MNPFETSFFRPLHKEWDLDLPWQLGLYDSMILLHRYLYLGVFSTQRSAITIPIKEMTHR